MTVFVGSTNPVKLHAVQLALRDVYPDAQVLGFETESGVGDQPLSDEETMLGARNRARAALAAGQVAHPEVTDVLGLGLEGGVFSTKQDGMWSTVWVVVADPAGQLYEANGARVRVSEVIAQRIRDGQEMGPIMQQLTGISDVRKKQGMFGIITNNYVDRTEAYSAIAKCAIGLWYGRDWDASLKKQSA